MIQKRLPYLCSSLAAQGFAEHIASDRKAALAMFRPADTTLFS